MAAAFTVSACPAIETRIASDLVLLRDAIFEAVGRGHVKTLALGGGFGRGEGTAFMANSRPHIVNDYDIRIIHDLPDSLFKARYAGRLDKVAEEYARSLAIKQIDFGGQHFRRLLHTPAPTIANYELFHGYHVFYGEDLLAAVAARIPVDHVPLWEGTWLLRNRTIGLILAGLYFLGGSVPGEASRENLWIEANKATLAVGDSFLLAQGRYHWSYVERGRRLAAWSGAEVEPWREAYCGAVTAKVDPGCCPYDRPVDELIGNWYRARDVMEQGFRWFEARRTGRTWQGWGDYLDRCVEVSTWRRPRFWANLLRAHTVAPRDAARRARVRTERVRSVGLAARLLFAVTSDGIDSEAVYHIASVVGLQPGGTAVAQWRRLAAFLLISIHPTGEAGRVAAQA
ncbi:MAG: hypothetical protein ACM30E_13140 [Nitrososphaerales archaeon]